jgi:hypothetical protein
MFCAPELVWGGTEGARSRFHVLRSADPFWAVPWAPGPVFMFCAPDLMGGGTEGVGSRFHVLCSQICFGLYRERCVQFSCFALLNSFRAVPRAPCPVFMFCVPPTHFGRYRGLRVQFCAPELVGGGTEGVGSRFSIIVPRPVLGGTRGAVSSFHVLRSRTRLGRYRGRLVPFSYFAFPRPVLGGTEGVGSSFHVLRSQNYLGRY